MDIATSRGSFYVAVNSTFSFNSVASLLFGAGLLMSRTLTSYRLDCNVCSSFVFAFHVCEWVSEWSLLRFYEYSSPQQKRINILNVFFGLIRLYYTAAVVRSPIPICHIYNVVKFVADSTEFHLKQQNWRHTWIVHRVFDDEIVRGTHAPITGHSHSHATSSVTNRHKMRRTEFVFDFERK